MRNPDLKKRILEISYKMGLSHIGSCINSVDIIADIYKKKGKDDIFILSNGHAGLALYVVIEANGGEKADFLFHKSGVHTTRYPKLGLHVSTGSLGHGLGIGIGMAIANPLRSIWVLLSDGESAEGSVWEALALARKLKLENLHIFFTANGYSAYDPVKAPDLEIKVKAFHKRAKVIKTSNDYIPFLQGVHAHYYVMKEKDWQWVEDNL